MKIYIVYIVVTTLYLFFCFLCIHIRKSSVFTLLFDDFETMTGKI